MGLAVGFSLTTLHFLVVGSDDPVVRQGGSGEPGDQEPRKRIFEFHRFLSLIADRSKPVRASPVPGES